MNKKKNLAEKIEKLNDIKYYANCFGIITKKHPKFTKNSNGIFFQFHLLDDDTLENLFKYIDKINSREKKKITIKEEELLSSDSNSSSSCTKYEKSDKIRAEKEYKPYVVDEFNESLNVKNIGPKLSNYEKSIIKRSRNSDVSFGETENVVLQHSKGKSSKKK